MKTMLIVDGNSILNRAFYGIRPLTNHEGLHTNAIYGMLNILLKQIDTLSPDCIVAAFDRSEPTFRHHYYNQYKANRHKMPEELAEQLPYAKKCLDFLGVTVLDLAGYEADDILGTLAKNAPNDTHVYLLTGDRDSLQLIDEKTSVLLAGNEATICYNTDLFVQKYGITPDIFVEVKALMGDSSDNIPGVSGIGEKTALKLISSYGSLDEIYKDPSALKETDSIKRKLIAGKESAYMSKYLAQIDTQVPLDITYEKMLAKTANKPELLSLFTHLEFFALTERLNLKKDPNALPAETFVVQDVPLDTLLNLPTDLSLGLQVTETQLSISDGKTIYRCSFSSWGELSELFQKNYTFVVSDVKALYHRLTQEKIYWKCTFFDTMLAGYVMDSSTSDYSLPKLASAYLKRSISENEDAAILALLKPVLQKEMDDRGFHELYFDIELPLAEILFDMEHFGFKVDIHGLNHFGQKLSQAISDYEDHIYQMAGGTFNINSPKQLGEVLFEKIGLPPIKKNKSGYSTNAEVLEKLRPYHPIIQEILDYRQVAKLKSTYVDGLIKAADKNERIHSTFNQAITATGRLSSTEPNLQNIPIKQELGRELRKYFIPENENYVLIDADYSQIELRLLAEISGDETMINAFKNGIDIHTLTASQVFNTPLEQVTPELRKRAKAVNFGIVYGISDYSLSLDIGVTKRTAAQYIESYMNKYPKIKEYLQQIIEKAKADGFVSTLYHRRRYIPELSSPKAPLRAFGERVAMNSPIQGTAADIIKLAMVNTAKALKKSGIDAKLILQVHDELIVESHVNCVEEATRILKQEMEHAARTSVPLTVDITVGHTWYDN